MELFRLWGSIMIDDKDAIKSLNDAEKKAKDSAKAVETLGNKAAAMGKAVAIGAGVAVTTLFGLATNSAKVAGDIDDASQRVGMSAEEYQKWTYAAKLSGLEQEKLESIMKKQQTVFADASMGVGTAAKAYQDLGIDISGLTADGAFEKVIMALANTEDETKRNAIANDLFGKSYADLAPLLNTGSEGIAALRQEAVDLGGVMSNESVASGAAFGDTLDKLKTTFGTVVAEIGVKVMPIFQQFADWIIANMPTIKATFETVFGAISNAIKFVIDNANWLLPVLAGVVGTLTTFSILTTVSNGLKLMQDMLGGATLKMGLFNAVMSANPIGVVALAIGALIAIGVLLWKNWDTVKEKAMGLWNSIKDIFGKIGDFVKGIFDGFRNVIKLPTISVEGSLNPATWLKNGLPKLNVKWNAEGGIFTEPTIFNTRAGLQGVGEAGAEAIMPLSKLDSMLSERQTIDYDLLGLAVKQALQGMTIELDKKPVGEFIDKRIIKGVY